MNPNDLTKEYTNGEVTIVWQSGKCIHSANCVKNNPDVFKPKEKPWITPKVRPPKRSSKRLTNVRPGL
ncbi:(4Fe-4S)-binding protein [Flavobacterium phycosphaerae]|uniref:(4Fe-4S)-binding protein n=1 Tax=Flavobacterium phycosphaerae TaxID=2697515 RepID=UPI0037441AAA